MLSMYGVGAYEDDGADKVRDTGGAAGRKWSVNDNGGA